MPLKENITKKISKPPFVTAANQNSFIILPSVVEFAVGQVEASDEVPHSPVLPVQNGTHSQEFRPISVGHLEKLQLP